MKKTQHSPRSTHSTRLTKAERDWLNEEGEYRNTITHPTPTVTLLPTEYCIRAFHIHDNEWKTFHFYDYTDTMKKAEQLMDTNEYCRVLLYKRVGEYNVTYQVTT